MLDGLNRDAVLIAAPALDELNHPLPDQPLFLRAKGDHHPVSPDHAFDNLVHSISPKNATTQQRDHCSPLELLRQRKNAVDLTRCPHRGKRLKAVLSSDQRTELKCSFCDGLDPFETDAALWVQSPTLFQGKRL
ncbi:hypothetical protein [Bradyrhizobium elkanii]|uniref:hypothetical protein n=1 Tax=Bradyrhizobium elkanii TaxID=29448 RepID=UPI001BAD6774|nr:hypothetical protein [Bradyrhizobium elkanii]MBR1164626.1 hypothetical protein [Bradyrhizobium elkanii]